MRYSVGRQIERSTQKCHSAFFLPLTAQSGLRHVPTILPLLQIPLAIASTLRTIPHVQNLSIHPFRQPDNFITGDQVPSP